MSHFIVRFKLRGNAHGKTHEDHIINIKDGTADIKSLFIKALYEDNPDQKEFELETEYYTVFSDICNNVLSSNLRRELNPNNTEDIAEEITEEEKNNWNLIFGKFKISESKNWLIEFHKNAYGYFGATELIDELGKLVQKYSFALYVSFFNAILSSHVTYAAKYHGKNLSFVNMHEMPLTSKTIEILRPYMNGDISKFSHNPYFSDCAYNDLLRAFEYDPECPAKILLSAFNNPRVEYGFYCDYYDELEEKSELKYLKSVVSWSSMPEATKSRILAWLDILEKNSCRVTRDEYAYITGAPYKNLDEFKNSTVEEEEGSLYEYCVHFMGQFLAEAPEIYTLDGYLEPDSNPTTDLKFDEWDNPKICTPFVYFYLANKNLSGDKLNYVVNRLIHMKKLIHRRNATLRANHVILTYLNRVERFYDFCFDILHSNINFDPAILLATDELFPMLLERAGSINTDIDVRKCSLRGMNNLLNSWNDQVSILDLSDKIDEFKMFNAFLYYSTFKPKIRECAEFKTAEAIEFSRELLDARGWGWSRLYDFLPKLALSRAVPDYFARDVNEREKKNLYNRFGTRVRYENPLATSIYERYVQRLPIFNIYKKSGSVHAFQGTDEKIAEYNKNIYVYKDYLKMPLVVYVYIPQEYKAEFTTEESTETAEKYVSEITILDGDINISYQVNRPSISNVIINYGAPPGQIAGQIAGESSASESSIDRKYIEDIYNMTPQNVNWSQIIKNPEEFIRNFENYMLLFPSRERFLTSHLNILNWIFTPLDNVHGFNWRHFDDVPQILRAYICEFQMNYLDFLKMYEMYNPYFCPTWIKNKIPKAYDPDHAQYFNNPTRACIQRIDEFIKNNKYCPSWGDFRAELDMELPQCFYKLFPRPPHTMRANGIDMDE